METTRPPPGIAGRGLTGAHTSSAEQFRWFGLRRFLGASQRYEWGSWEERGSPPSLPPLGRSPSVQEPAPDSSMYYVPPAPAPGPGPGPGGDDEGSEDELHDERGVCAACTDLSTPPTPPTQTYPQFVGQTPQSGGFRELAGTDRKGSGTPPPRPQRHGIWGHWPALPGQGAGRRSRSRRGNRVPWLE